MAKYHYYEYVDDEQKEWSRSLNEPLLKAARVALSSVPGWNLELVNHEVEGEGCYFYILFVGPEGQRIKVMPGFALAFVSDLIVHHAISEIMGVEIQVALTPEGEDEEFIVGMDEMIARRAESQKKVLDSIIAHILADSDLLQDTPQQWIGGVFERDGRMYCVWNEDADREDEVIPAHTVPGISNMGRVIVLLEDGWHLADVDGGTVAVDYPDGRDFPFDSFPAENILTFVEYSGGW